MVRVEHSSKRYLKVCVAGSSWFLRLLVVTGHQSLQRLQRCVSIWYDIEVNLFSLQSILLQHFLIIIFHLVFIFKSFLEQWVMHSFLDMVHHWLKWCLVTDSGFRPSINPMLTYNPWDPAVFYLWDILSKLTCFIHANAHNSVPFGDVI